MSRTHPPRALSKRTQHSWGIVLAGGEGRRLQQYIRTEYGNTRPKQFCTLFGSRTMLRNTVERAAMLIPRDQLLTVVNRHHLSYAMEDLTDHPPHTVIIQPFSCETGPGILLPLVHIAHRDPEAKVAIFPSDHFILEEERFMRHVREAFARLNGFPGFIITLGIEPSNLQPGYGWIERGESLGPQGKNLYRVRKFWEKPDQEFARYLHLNGCLWNTMTIVGSASLFLNLYRILVPEVYNPFQKIWNALGSSREEDVVEEVFRSLPSVDFSRAILERSPHHLAVLTVKNVYWSDWGDEHRVRADLARFDGRHEQSEIPLHAGISS